MAPCLAYRYFILDTDHPDVAAGLGTLRGFTGAVGHTQWQQYVRDLVTKVFPKGIADTRLRCPHGAVLDVREGGVPPERDPNFVPSSARTSYERSPSVNRHSAAVFDRDFNVGTLRTTSAGMAGGASRDVFVISLCVTGDDPPLSVLKP